jgi:hypothetical protein
MGEPSRPTIKKLFALSGNQCAFPNCSIPVVYSGTDSIVCEVCHIKGEKSTAARHDDSQSEEERHGFDNLILLCNVHHKVVDDDPLAYTVERLNRMKADHARKFQWTAVDDALAERVAVLIQNNTVFGGSIIHTQNQSGGQTAHSIINYHQAARDLDQVIAEAMVAQLRQFPGEPFRVISLSSDGSTMRLARRLESILQLSGWRSQQNVSLTICPDPVAGDVVLNLPCQKPSFDALIALLRQAGLDSRSEIRAGLQMLEVTVTSK